jgi:hypothetical protein
MSMSLGKEQLAAETVNDPRVGIGRGPNAARRRQLRVRGANHRGLLPSILSRPAGSAGKRPVPPDRR